MRLIKKNQINPSPYPKYSATTIVSAQVVNGTSYSYFSIHLVFHLMSYWGDRDWEALEQQDPDFLSTDLSCIKVDIWVLPLAHYRNGLRAAMYAGWYHLRTLYIDNLSQLDRALQGNQTGGLYTRRSVCIEHGAFYKVRRFTHGVPTYTWHFKEENHV